MLLRYAHALPRCLQDVREDIIIITCKTCRHVAKMPLYGAVSRYQSLVGVIGRSYDPIVRDYVADHT
jgi:hypothetical protein